MEVLKKRGERKTAKEQPSMAKKKANKVQNEAVDQTEENSTSNRSDGSKIEVSEFDYSAENHFRAMDMICKLCGEADTSSFDTSAIERIASSIIFLREWRCFDYGSRVIRFMSETGHPNAKEAHDETRLPQFSAASVPKCDIEVEKVSGAAVSTEPRNDFVLYVGGLVWALDWCPRPDQGSNCDTKCEFIAVAAHPPDSTYHKLGARLSGRGMIQIWCLLNCTLAKEDKLSPVGNTKRKYQKNNVAKKDEDKPKRPRGRPRKNAIDKTPALADLEGPLCQALVVQLPENSSDVPPVDENMPSIPALQNVPDPVGNPKENCLMTAAAKENKPKRPRGRPRKNAVVKTPGVLDPEGQLLPALADQRPEETSIVLPMDESMQTNPAPHKGKGKKRKAVTQKNKIVDKSSDVPGSEEPLFQALAIKFPENTANISSTEEDLLNTPDPQEEAVHKQEVSSERVPTADLECTLSSLRKMSRKKSKAKANQMHDITKLPTQDEDEERSTASLQEKFSRKDMVAEENVPGESPSAPCSGGCHAPKDVILPRVVFCLGHEGKVAWDVKWRPSDACESVNMHRMGYLAVVLGNGSIEVWEIPSPQIIKCIYASRQSAATDPRFAKLKPVFKCSALEIGDRQSMPLTMEWSAYPPHDLILAGCHDGTVALWKFSTNCSSEDVKPLLCFSAETVPIRAISWAPFGGDPESLNVIVTAGHGGLKFWDLRDPFRPLWDANPSQRFIYGLDWLPDPRCVIVSYDDGTIRILSLSRAAYDVPVTGEPFSGTQHQGLHSYCCSSFAIWSIHVSRLTGMVAYCSADGTVLYFQLTHKAVDKDPLRNRAPHFLCGVLADEESAVTVNSHLPSSPHRMKKSATEWANTPRSARSVVSGSNQARRGRKGVEKGQNPDDQILALCNGHDAGNGDKNEAQRTSKSGKGKTRKSGNTNLDQALVCTARDGVNMNGKEDAADDIEVPPSKIVSMYKVRWNMNKGSERWLCYGGAAGIVRCQEIIAPVVDKKLLRR